MLRVLLVRAGALGDILLLRRAVFALKRAGHGVALLAPAASGFALVGHGPSDVDRLIGWDRPEVAALLTDDGLPSGPLRDALASFDAVIAYTRSAALARGLAATGPRVVVHDPSPHPGRGHAADWLAEPLTPLGIAIPAETLPSSIPTPEEDAPARPVLDRLPEKFLAIHTGSGSPSKNWPSERFWELAEARGGGGGWLHLMGPAEARHRPPQGAVVARGLPPRVVGAVVSRAGVYVGNDSGITHLAAAWGAPTVALFGPTDPGVWAPVGADVRIVRSKTGGMEGITIEDVVSST